MADLLSIPPTTVLPILQVRCATYETWKEQYQIDTDFKNIWHAVQNPTVINQTPFLDYTIRDGWLYKLNLLCVPHSEDRLLLIKETHASTYGGHFGTTKTLCCTRICLGQLLGIGAVPVKVSARLTHYFFISA